MREEGRPKVSAMLLPSLVCQIYFLRGGEGKNTSGNNSFKECASRDLWDNNLPHACAYTIKNQIHLTKAS